MRAAALLAVLVMVVPAFALPGLATSGPGTAWRGKADDFLLRAYDRGDARESVELTGPAVRQPAVGFGEDRAAWERYWQSQSAPFFAAMAQAAARVGATVTFQVAAVDAVFVQAPRAAVPDLVGQAPVRRAALDWVGRLHVVDGAPSPQGQGPGTEVNLANTTAKIQADKLWALGYRGEGVKLAMVDTGIRSTHEMFKNADGTTRVAKWHDSTGTCPGSPCDGDGHGTHTASTAAGSNLFNPTSPQGVAPRVTLYGAKGLDDHGSGTIQQLSDALQWSFDAGADVSSNSWGGSCDDTLNSLVQTLSRAGMVSVFAAGNSGPGQGTVECPGLLDEVITVGAVDINENVASFSSRGPCQDRICPDVMAVGVQVTAAYNCSDTCYATLDGTSMATPHVAGLYALLLEASRATRGKGLAPAPVKEGEVLLRYTAKDEGAAGPDDDDGWGLAQGLAAYHALQEGVDLTSQATDAPPVMHYGDSAILSFGVAELGQANVSGHFRFVVRQTDFGACPPACDTTVLADQDVVLAGASEALGTYGFFGSDHAPGNYSVEGTFTYSYTDPATGLVKTGTLSHTSTFLLKRVLWQVQEEFPAASHTGDLLLGGLAVTNAGNEKASSVALSEDWSANGYAPVAAVPPGVGAFGYFANPAPSLVSVPHPSDTQDERVHYEWDLSAVPAGTGWGAAYNFAAGLPGAYLWRERIAYTDEAGKAYTVDLQETRTVALP